MRESLGGLRNEELEERLKALVRDERTLLAELVAHLMEFDRRKLYADAGYHSLFAYCTRELGYSEDEACRRINTARAAQRFPLVLELLEEGELRMTAVSVLGPLLTETNHRDLLLQARGKPRRELEALAASLAPRPDVRDYVRLSPMSPSQGLAPQGDGVQSAAGPFVVPATGETDLPMTGSAAPLGFKASASQSIEPLSPQRVHFGFTGSVELLAMVERARELFRHKHPAGRLEDIFQEALVALLEKKGPERKRRPAARRPKAGEADGTRPQPHPQPQPHRAIDAGDGRRIPQWVKDEVWRRDGGRCSFQRPDGARCGARG